MKNNIHGVGVALVTPFDNKGKVDFSALGKLVEYVISGGVDYLVALGTTAETPTLSSEEKVEIADYIRRINAGRLPLVLGVGGNSTREVASTIEKTGFEGITAILSVTPYYNKPTQDGLYEHYKAVAAASPVPVILYNVPARTGVNMTAPTTLKIANEIDNVLGVKEACGSIPQMAEILRFRPSGFKVISGDDCMALPLNSIGGDGIISVAANAFPAKFTAMMRYAAQGLVQKSAAEFLDLFQALEDMFEEGNPAGVKAALQCKGITGDTVRLPLVPASAALKEKFCVLIERYGL